MWHDRRSQAVCRSFDRTLERAIVALLDTPAVDASARLKPKGIGYAYTDERLESLTAAQKQLLRMGPRNVRIIKARLRDIALARSRHLAAIRRAFPGARPSGLSRGSLLHLLVSPPIAVNRAASAEPYGHATC